MKFNHSYMKTIEFKSRQAYLPFDDAVGIVLEIMSKQLTVAMEWFKPYFSKKTKRAVKPFQFDIFCQYIFTDRYYQLSSKIPFSK